MIAYEVQPALITVQFYCKDGKNNRRMGYSNYRRFYIPMDEIESGIWHVCHEMDLIFYGEKRFKEMFTEFQKDKNKCQNELITYDKDEPVKESL